MAAHCRLYTNFWIGEHMTVIFGWKLNVTTLGVSVMWQQPDIPTCNFFSIFFSLWLSVFRLNSFLWVFPLLLGSWLAVSCVSAYEQCKSFTVLRFPLLLLCFVIADLFSALLRCVHRVWLLILGCFMALLAVPFTPVPDDWSAVPLQLIYKRALISSLNLLQGILRGVSFLNKLTAALISLWLSFRNMAAIREWTFQGRCWNVDSVPKKCTVMLECDPSTHVIRFGVFSHRWQAKRKLAIFLCSLFVLRWFFKACFSCWQQRDSLHGYYGGWLLSVNSSFFFFVVVVVIG